MYYGVLCGFAYKFTEDMDQAEELVQELFVQLWDKRETLVPNSSVKSYLFTATRNACLNHLKHQKVRAKFAEAVQAQPMPQMGDAGEALEAAELKARIELAIEDLPERCREVFVMSRYEGLKYQEIADKLQISARTVEVQVGKALKMMRDHLRDFLPVVLWLLLEMEGWG